ncbi:SDR family NAD(P)-dependent oxidoreductase [Plantactinospora sp. WMMC1484]|uniref:SDR family NAD(P)-dependent oxidoreductase n=1 Tax=Plantactinospora sp. WMMC1484 TaxID=3404122 RepID=UPI003BF46ABA
MSTAWTPDQMPDQTGRTAVITGASSGLGLVAAARLAGRGATVIMAVRDVAKGERVRAELDGDLLVRRLDLADLESVRAFAAGLRAEGLRIDLLLNNAGTSGTRRDGPTPAGYEPVLATNHLGHFALTGLLLPLFRPDRDPRVVTVGSGLYHMLRRSDPADLAGELTASSGVRYIRAKQANVIFGVELDRRLRRSGSPVRSLLAHPGMARTPMQDHDLTPAKWLVTRLGGLLLARSPERGTIPLLYAATSPDAHPGVLYGPSAYRWDSRVHTRPLVAPATDRGLAARLWTVSQAATGVAYLDVPDAAQVDVPAFPAVAQLAAPVAGQPAAPVGPVGAPGAADRPREVLD